MISPNNRQGNNHDTSSNDTILYNINDCLTCDDPIKQDVIINPTLQQLGIELNSSSFNNNQDNTTNNYCSIPSSVSLPSNLQLCGCLMRDIAKNTLELNNFLNPLYSQRQKHFEQQQQHHQQQQQYQDYDQLLTRQQIDIKTLIRPRKLKLDKTLAKYKHKSLPVSPVNEERQFSDYINENPRKSFSYFIDFNNKSNTDEGLKQICQDIERFSQDFSKNYDEIEQMNNVPNISITKVPKRDVNNDIVNRCDDLIKEQQEDEEDEGSFSSDSLEDFSFNSTKQLKNKIKVPPRRCVSSNEIYKYQQEDENCYRHVEYYHNYDCKVPKTKSASFYLNQSDKNSQESIVDTDDDEYGRKNKSYCNSMESVVSNESDCKSAPLEALFGRKKMYYYNEESDEDYTKSLPKNIGNNNNNNNSSEFYGTTSQSEYQFIANYSTEIKRTKSLYNYNVNKQQEYQQQIVIGTPKKSVKTIETQTDYSLYETPEEKVTKRANTSKDFQQKLLKFEKQIAQNKKAIAFFVDAKQKTNNTPCTMYIPSLETKNKQYKSKFCNVLNNKPDTNVENIYESSGTSSNSNKRNNCTGNFTLTNVNFGTKNNNKQFRETSSLDRHLFSKSFALGNDKIVHKPPKGVRRNNSTKMRKNKTTYEYIKKDEFYLKNTNYKQAQQNNLKQLNYEKNNDENKAPSNNEKTIEYNFKEKNIDKDCESSSSSSNKNYFYDSIDNNIKMDYDSLDPNPLQQQQQRDDDGKMYDSLEYDKNLWRNCDDEEKNKLIDSINYIDVYENRITLTLENVKILNDIQKKIIKINHLVEIIKENMFAGKVRRLSSMYEQMKLNTNHLNQKPILYRKRNLSLPNFVERHLSYGCQIDDDDGGGGGGGGVKENNEDDTKRVAGQQRYLTFVYWCIKSMMYYTLPILKEQTIFNSIVYKFY